MHTPVLQKEVLAYLDPRPNENFIDATIGEGGHALAILERTKPSGKLFGIEWDLEQIEKLQVSSFKFQVSGRIVLVCDNFANLKNIVEKYNFYPVHGILFDLGISSWHLEESGRGFSFLRDELLDMRLRYDINPKSKIQNSKLQVKIKNKNIKNYELTAEAIVNKWPQSEIEKILREYGQERFAARIAKKIVEQRKIKPIKTTFQLVDVIKRATPVWYHHRKIHPATRTFQALRIAVNDELGNLKAVLPQAVEILEPLGRMVVISFHSLEDRIVKNFFRDEEKRGRIQILTKKPVVPSKEELLQNPRSRSAKLRAAMKARNAL